MLVFLDRLPLADDQVLGLVCLVLGLLRCARRGRHDQNQARRSDQAQGSHDVLLSVRVARTRQVSSSVYAQSIVKRETGAAGYFSSANLSPIFAGQPLSL